MKLSNEGVYKPCPKCNGRMELFKHANGEFPPFYECSSCGHEETVRHFLREVMHGDAINCQGIVFEVEEVITQYYDGKEILVTFIDYDGVYRGWSSESHGGYVDYCDEHPLMNLGRNNSLPVIK